MRNCHAYREAYSYHDKTPSLYHLLLVLEHPWQHIYVDFKSFLVDREGFNNIYMFVNRLSKVAVLIPYKKTITIKEIAKLYYVYIYRYYDLLESIVLDYSP